MAINRFQELALITRCVAADDRNAFGQFVDAYSESLRRFLLGLTKGDSALADDLAQETFLKAYLSIRSLEGVTRFRSWLFRIAYNVFLDYTRSKRPTADTDTTAAAMKLSDTTDCGMRMDLYKALAILSPIERSCITLQLTDGYKIDKIAEITGLSPNTVKSHLSRGKFKLSNYLKQNGYDKR